MKADFHIHTGLCGHADGEMYEYVNAAIDAGLEVICFTDHSPLPIDIDSRYRMKESELPGYVEAVLDLKKQYCSKIDVRLGIEADYYPGTAKYIEALIGKYPFDYVIGSVHYINGWGFDNPEYVDGFEKKDIDNIYAEYVKLLVSAAKSGLFDVLGHPDLIKKFGHFPAVDPIKYWKPLITVLKNCGMGIEVNTAGLRKPVGEIYPGLNFLKTASACGLPVTIGSDAHSPSEVAYHFDEAVDLLKSVGYTRCATYQNRKTVFTML